MDELSGYDLIVAADGLNSLVRRSYESAFGASVSHSTNKFAWYGTTKRFATLSQTFVKTDLGSFNAHHYRYAPAMSTFLVECDAATWQAYGFEGKSIEHKVTLAEGLTSYQIVQKLLAHPELKGEITEIPPEGSLLPDTYKFGRNDTRQNIIEIGMRSANFERGFGGAGIQDVKEESLMLTGDENTVDIDFVVYWRIKNAEEYLFNIQNPDNTVKEVAESAMREIVGQSNIQPILTEARAKTETAVLDLIQRTLDSYKAGIQIEEVSLEELAQLPALNAKGGISAVEAILHHRAQIAEVGAGYDQRVRRRIESGAQISAPDYVEILTMRQKLIGQFNRAMTGFDALPPRGPLNERNLIKALRLAETGGATTILITGKGEPTLYPEEVRDYLAARGIQPSRMRTVSYGKERPVAVCNDISCWSQNRRAVTVLGVTS